MCVQYLLYKTTALRKCIWMVTPSQPTHASTNLHVRLGAARRPHNNHNPGTQGESTVEASRGYTNSMTCRVHHGGGAEIPNWKRNVRSSVRITNTTQHNHYNIHSTTQQSTWLKSPRSTTTLVHIIITTSSTQCKPRWRSNSITGCRS